MNIAFPLNRCFEEVSLLAQAASADGVSWIAMLLVAAFVAVAALFAIMRRGRNPRVNRSDIEVPPGDPFAAARKDEEELASANARASDQTR